MSYFIRWNRHLKFALMNTVEHQFKSNLMKQIKFTNRKTVRIPSVVQRIDSISIFVSKETRNVRNLWVLNCGKWGWLERAVPQQLCPFVLTMNSVLLSEKSPLSSWFWRIKSKQLRFFPLCTWKCLIRINFSSFWQQFTKITYLKARFGPNEFCTAVWWVPR